MLGRAQEMSEADLRAALKSPRADERFVAAYAVGERRLPWPADLLPMVLDPNEMVRQGARRSLIVLSYFELNPADQFRLRATGASWTKPVDFGPLVGASASARTAARDRWAAWWDGRPAAAGRGGATAGSPGANVVELSSNRWGRELLAAPADRQREMIAGHRDAKGIEYTDAMADTAAMASGDLRKALREALAERLWRMTPRTLTDYLNDPRAEIRRAAVLALAMKETAAAADQMIDLLADREPTVVRATHAALKSLTSQDFGPAVDATEAEREAAAERWRKWFAANPAK